MAVKIAGWLWLPFAALAMLGVLSALWLTTGGAL